MEIAEWLRLNAKEPYRYVILDDEEDILFTQREHLVKVDGSKGLDKADIDNVITDMAGRMTSFAMGPYRIQAYQLG